MNLWKNGICKTITWISWGPIFAALNLYIQNKQDKLMKTTLSVQNVFE